MAVSSSDEDSDDVTALRRQLAEAQELADNLTQRVHELIVERGQLYQERSLLRTRLQSAELGEELRQAGVWD